ncbi:hypothetical protein CALCODRAFT_521407 [Calocera cornea HHB12733]|uniref:DNA replication checkpoint mediator MRC1 domain-containing protein n=1 Tax=Calocera cornea HHB12733 TaxID=1353952 RepID=A0A165CTE6_9BASI|nr:hypothetical protein CALCODRAFT_521407 [Calocera cornea HHB12733]
MPPSPSRNIIIPDSEPTRQVSPLRTSPQHAMEVKSKVRVTYGRPKPAVPVVAEQEEQEDDALPPSSPPRVDQSGSSTLTEEVALPLYEVEDRVGLDKPHLHDDDEEAMEDDAESGFNWDWKKKLAALDESDDEEPAPVAPARAKQLAANLFSGSIPALTSSSMPPTSPAKAGQKRPARRVLSSPSSSAAASPPRRSTRDRDDSSAVSEGPSKLFESPVKAALEEDETPDSSPVKTAAKPFNRAQSVSLFSPPGSNSSRRAVSAEPQRSPASAGLGRKKKLRELVAARPREASNSPTPPRRVSVAPEGSGGEAKPKKSRRRSGSMSEHEGSGAEKAAKKPKKLNKKEIDQMNKETARMLAAQDASIPRYENRLSLTSLFKTIQMANLSNSQIVETAATTQLKKLPRPTNMAYRQKVAPVEDDPIIDASSPLVRNAQSRASFVATAPSSSAPASSQVPAIEASSGPPIQRTVSAPPPLLPLSNDTEDDLPDTDTVLAEDRERRLQQQLKVEEEKRRQYKIALLQRRQEQSVKTAAELLRGKEAESDSDLEIDDGELNSTRKTPGSAKKGFLDRLIQTTSKTRHSAETITDSQLDRAAKPHFDLSSPPSARKNGKKDPFINRDVLNRTLLKKAGKLAAQESHRKEEEWRSRGGRKRELKQEDITAAIQQALEQQQAAAAADEDADDSFDDGDWEPSEAGSENENEENNGGSTYVEDEAMDEDDVPAQSIEDAEVTVRSPSYADSNKENDNENKENVAPSSRPTRSILGEMQLDPAPAEDATDSEGDEPWRPRKKRKLASGVGLVLDDDDDDDDDEAENHESTPVALPRKLFSDATEPDDDALPVPIAGIGACLDDGADDLFGSGFANGLGAGGLSQFFAQTQADANPLSQLRQAVADELDNIPVPNLLPAVELSTQQIQLQEAVFQEDQESRIQDALRAANEKANQHPRPEATRLVLAESFQMDDFTQRDGLNSTDDFQVAGSVTKIQDSGMDDDEPPAQPLRRLRRHIDDGGLPLEAALTAQEENEEPEPEPVRAELNVFEVMRKNAAREEKKALRKKMKHLLVEGEAEEEEEEAMLGFSVGREPHESDEDSDNDAVLPGLVDDQVMDAETVAKEKVLEKVAEHQAEDDAALEKYHKDVIEGKKRLRRRGDDFLSDSDDDDNRRRYGPTVFRRKDGATEVEAYGLNPETRPFYQAYQNTVAAHDEHEFDHLNAPVPEDSDTEAESDDEANEGDKPVREMVSAAQLREELREAARNKAAITPLMNVDDVSWVDQEDSDMEDGSRSYRNLANASRTRVPPPTVNDEDLLLAARTKKLDAKQQARLERFRKEDSYNANSSRGGAAVTGFVKNKPAQKQAPAKNKKATRVAPRKSAVFERQGKFAS